MTWTPTTQQAVKETLYNLYMRFYYDNGNLKEIEGARKALLLIRQEEENK